MTEQWHLTRQEIEFSACEWTNIIRDLDRWYANHSESAAA